MSLPEHREAFARRFSSPDIRTASEYDAWPLDLRRLWPLLSTPEQVALLRERWAWRVASPGALVPGPARPGANYARARNLLRVQEAGYRLSSSCRGAGRDV